MSILHVIDQNQNKFGDAYGCGIACLAMTLSLDSGNIEKKYNEVRKLLFPTYPKGKLYRGKLDLRTGVKVLNKVLHESGVSTELTTHSKKDFNDYPAAILLITYDDTLHWVLAFELNKKRYIADTELQDYWEEEDYFTKGYKVVKDKMFIGLPETKIKKVKMWEKQT